MWVLLANGIILSSKLVRGQTIFLTTTLNPANCKYFAASQALWQAGSQCYVFSQMSLSQQQQVGSMMYLELIVKLFVASPGMLTSLFAGFTRYVLVHWAHQRPGAEYDR